MKLKDKQSAYGVFRGDMYEFWSIWQNGKPIPAHQDQPGAKFRFRINFIVKEGASYVPKIWEQGQLVYEQLSEIHDELNLETMIIKITRNGEALDTTYSIIPTKPVDAQMADTLKHIKLLDLEGKTGEKGTGPADFGDEFGPPPPEEHDEIPF